MDIIKEEIIMGVTKQEIIDLAKKYGADVVGFGNVERWAGAPDGHKPCDLLPGAKTVITFGQRIPMAVCHMWGNPSNSIYSVYGHKMQDLELLDITFELCKRLESDYQLALPIVPTQIFKGKEEMMAEFSLKHSAVACGLGEFGHNNFVVTKKYGPRIRWGAVITRAEFEPDPIITEPICKRCYECVNVCPVRAASMTEETIVTIEGHDYKMGKFDKYACRWAEHGMLKAAGGFKDIPLPPPEERNSESYWKGSHARDPWQQKIQAGYGGVPLCGVCVAKCKCGEDIENMPF